MHMLLENMRLDDTGRPSASRDAPGPSSDSVVNAYYESSSARRVDTDTVMVTALRKQHPTLQVTVVPPGFGPVDLLNWAQATGQASFSPIIDPDDRAADPLEWRMYLPPGRRPPDGVDGGRVLRALRFGKYDFTYKNTSYLLYVADGRDGSGAYPKIQNQYLVHAPGASSSADVDTLIRAAGSWAVALHGEIWVFDGGLWSKDAGLWQSVQKARWEDVILAEDTKIALQEDVTRFFDGHDRYARLRVPWKRGVIYHGPPGNGKTISIKATMHSLYNSRKPTVPSLYVRSLTSPLGPERSIKMIFARARAEAPCLLIFEDLDALITDSVRSYFLNEVDGLAVNDGVLIIGSTNHLDRLDPGLSKRPSRFDRKFFFPKPDFTQRRRYAQYWRTKLANTASRSHCNAGDKDAGDKNDDGNDSVNDNDSNDRPAFPERLTREIARITDGFSFAYMQEAFVATLLALAAMPDDGDDDGDDDDSDDDEDDDNNSDDEMEEHVHVCLGGHGKASPVKGKSKSMSQNKDKPKDKSKGAGKDASGGTYRKAVWFVGQEVDDDDDDNDYNGNKDKDGDKDGDVDRLILWIEFQKQVKILREEM